MSVLSAFAKCCRKVGGFIFRANVNTLLKVLTLFMVSAFANSESVAQELPTQEYQIKGAFLFNFAQFVEWPSSAFPDAASPIVIGIFGPDPFGSFLDELVDDEIINGREVVIKRFSKENEIADTHILFVHKSIRYASGKLFSLAQHENILTISDSDGFTKKGGLIRFFNERSKIKFEINVGAMKRSNILFSSKVMRLAVLCCDDES